MSPNQVKRYSSIAAMMFCCLAAMMASVCAVSAEPGPTRVHVIKAPTGCFVPDVVMDAKGVLHMVYALNRNAYYVRSTDNAATFTPPVQVNSDGTVEFKMGERGSKLAVGSDGAVHVVWVDCWSPGVKTFVRYSRSIDGGKTFEPLKAVSSISGVDGVTLAASGSGDVRAFWHVAQPPQKEIPQATWIHVARSTDNGVTFAHDEPIQIDNHTGLACSMCMMRARFGEDGTAYLAFRSAEKNIRDFYLLRAPKGENRFTAVPVNRDHWELMKCPMCGPELTVGPDGRLLCAFMSRHKVFWAVSDHGTNFRLHVTTPEHEQDEIYPTAVANRRGEVLFVWQVGPMSTTGHATVHWATYTRDGKFSGHQDVIGKTRSGTKATAFVGTDDDFYVVTTAG